MKDQPISDGGSPKVDAEALGSWVAETAAEEGVSQQELLNQIISSYWVLEELSDVIVDPDGDISPLNKRPRGRVSESQTDDTSDGEPQQPDGGDEADSEEETLEFSSIKQELNELRTVIDELSDDESLSSPKDEQPARSEPTRPSNQQPPQSDTPPQQQPGGGSESVDPDDGFDELTSAAVGGSRGESSGAIDDLEGELDEVRHRLTELETAVNEQHSGEAADLDDLADLEAWIQTEFDNIEDVLEHLISRTDNLDSHIESSGAIDDLEGELDEVRHRLTELETAVNEQHSGEAADLDDLADLEAWIQTEFDNIEDVLEHLISRTDNLDSRIESAVDSHSERLEPLQEARAEQEDLTALKAEAIQKDVGTAACADCGESTDIGVLPTPYCPNCETKLIGVEAGRRWNPFDKPMLQTPSNRPGKEGLAQPPDESRGSTERSKRSSPPRQAGGDYQEPGSDSEFEWVDKG